MKKDLFIDTSAWYAVADISDNNHETARIFLSESLKSYHNLITSNCIIGETYTLINMRLGYQSAWSFIERVKSSTRLKVIFVDEVMESKAYKILRLFRDQKFSYIDGTSFALMKEKGIKEAFTYDSHFVIAGFYKLPIV